MDHEILSDHVENRNVRTALAYRHCRTSCEREYGSHTKFIKQNMDPPFLFACNRKSRYVSSVQRLAVTLNITAIKSHKMRTETTVHYKEEN